MGHYTLKDGKVIHTKTKKPASKAGKSKPNKESEETQSNASQEEIQPRSL
jgi:hypothetical protein